MSKIDQVTEAFRSLYGVEPAGVWAAPGRVNLIGEHTDYNAGLCLPIALPQRTYAAVARRDDDVVRAYSVDLGGDPVIIEIEEVAPGKPDGWASYVAGVVWALRQAGFAVGGLDIVVGSNVPIGGGLSSSAALEGSVAAAASDLFDLGLLADDDGRTQLAAACQKAENEIAQAPTGGLDQAASLRSLEHHALLIDFVDHSATPVPFRLDDHGLALLVMNTRVSHALVDGQYGQRRASCEEAAAILGLASLREVPFDGLDAALAALPDDVLRRRTKHVVTEIERVRETVAAMEVDDFDTVGQLFNASHASLRDDYEVSCEELDVACEVATAAGALGARMTGGGFGGSAIALVAADRVKDVSAAVAEAFVTRGFREPELFAVHAAPAAGRVN